MTEASSIQPDHNGLFTLSGKPFNQRLYMVPLSLACLLASIWLWNAGALDRPVFGENASQSDQDQQMTTGFVTLIVFAIGVIAPYNCHVFLDCTSRHLIQKTSYAGISVSVQRLAWSETKQIVLRHQELQTEGPTEYSGEIGFKPRDEEEPIWVKSFPATAEGISVETRQFARKLHLITGIALKPYSSIERHTQEVSRLVNSPKNEVP
jgi:hypothetical protein